MKYKEIIIFIEGVKDESFVRRIIKPELEKKYTCVKLYPYSKKSDKIVNLYLKSIKKIEYSDYIFLSDFDSSPCVSFKKNKLIRKKDLEKEKIIIVIKEIESWYIAGLNKGSSKKLGTPYYNNTDNFDKEQFHKIKPNKFRSDIDFMQEVLNHYQIETAKRKNKSCKYFFSKISR